MSKVCDNCGYEEDVNAYICHNCGYMFDVDVKNDTLSTINTENLDNNDTVEVTNSAEVNCTNIDSDNVPVTNKYKYCIFCGTKIIYEASFCTCCGKKTIKLEDNSNRFCRFCGTKIGENNLACPTCGKAAINNNNETIPMSESDISKYKTFGYIGLSISIFSLVFLLFCAEDFFSNGKNQIFQEFFPSIIISGAVLSIISLCKLKKVNVNFKTLTVISIIISAITFFLYRIGGENGLGLLIFFVLMGKFGGSSCG